MITCSIRRSFRRDSNKQLANIIIMSTAAAAATTTLARYIQEVTICSLCLDNFTDPRSLPCVHTFCLKCLDGLCSTGVSAQSRGRHGRAAPVSGLTLPCPMCRTPFHVPESGADGLPRNFFVENLLMAKQIADRRRTLCEVCASIHQDATNPESPGVATVPAAAAAAVDVAEFFCIECRMKLCARCSRSHAAIRPRPHHVTRIGDPVSWDLLKSRSDYCSRHVDYPVAMYCTDCDEPACLMCLFARHQSHSCVELDASVASRFEAQTSTDAEAIELLLTDAERHLAVVDEFVSAAERVDAEITARRELLMRLVDEDATRMRNELRRIRSDAERTMTLDERRRKIGEVIREMGTFAAYLKELSGKGSPLDVIRSARQCHLRAVEVKDSMRNAGLDGVCAVPVVEFVTSDLDTAQWFGRLKVTVPEIISTDNQPISSSSQHVGGTGHATVTSHSTVTSHPTAAAAATAHTAHTCNAQEPNKMPPVKPARRNQQTRNAESNHHHNNNNNNNNNSSSHHLQTSSTCATVLNTTSHTTTANHLGAPETESRSVSTSAAQRHDQRLQRPAVMGATTQATDAASNTAQQLLPHTTDSTHYRRHNGFTARSHGEQFPADPPPPPLPPPRPRRPSAAFPPAAPAAAAAAPGNGDAVKQRINSVDGLRTSHQQPQLYKVTLSLSSDRYVGCYDEDNVLFDSGDELDGVWRPYDHEAVESWLVNSGSTADFYHVGAVHPTSLNQRQFNNFVPSNNNNNIYRRKQWKRHPDNFFPPGKGHVMPGQRRWTASVQSVRAYSADRINNNIYNNINTAHMTSDVGVENRRSSRLERRPAILRQDRSARQPRRHEVAPPSTADPGSSWRRGRGGRMGDGAVIVQGGLAGGEGRVSGRHQVGRHVDSLSLPGDVDGWMNYGARMEDVGGTLVAC